MSAASLVALVSSGIAYLVYSRILTPAEFGLYAGALVISKFGTVVLDGGIKLALIRDAAQLGAHVERTAFVICASIALIGLAILTLTLLALASVDALTLHDALFLGLYSLPYFLSYPFLVVPLARLERGLQFGPVAKAEGFTTAIEYGLPAILWIVIAPGFWAFVTSVLIARGLRVYLIHRQFSEREWLSFEGAKWNQVRSLLTLGLSFQLASVASIMRDSLHFIVVAPFFGREVAGNYAWVMQLCGMTSQVFVQTASRVGLPWLLASSEMKERWSAALTQIVWLTALTFPPLLSLQFVAPAVNDQFFKGQWSGALTLLPFLIWRMLPGIATTPLGTMLVAQHGAAAYARENFIWATCEAGVAVAAVVFIGATGLAWSYSLMAWFGLFLFAARTGGRLAIGDVIRSLVARPSLWVAAALSLGYAYLVPASREQTVRAVVVSGCVCVIALLAEPRVRSWVFSHKPTGTPT